MRVAAIQMTSTSDKHQNLSEAHRLLLEARDRGAEVIAFPENFSILTDDPKEFLDAAETLKGLTVETLQEWAAEYDLWILGGSIPLKTKTPGKLTNTSLLISADGEITARYDKIHLFDVNLSGDRAYQESDMIRPGSKCVVAKKTPWCQMGLSICYDLRFPELYRKLSKLGAEVIFAPSAFTAFTGKAHWDVLTRARAIENQAFIVAPAQTGQPTASRKTHGHTRIVDPWGRTLAERPAGPGVVIADLSFAELERIRKELPALEHRRL
jgi:predicted amidohydrolase